MIVRGEEAGSAGDGPAQGLGVRRLLRQVIESGAGRGRELCCIEYCSI